MNILYINHYAGTPELGMEYRPYYLAREWVRLGHRVMMLAASYSHYRARQPKMDGPLRQETIDGIEYRWLRTPAYKGNRYGRGLNVMSFLWQVLRDAPLMASTFKPDVVIASSTYPLDIWVARRVARLARVRLVFEVHDLWPLSPIELAGMSPWHPFAQLCFQAERVAYRDADVVVSMLPAVHEHMASKGLDLRKLVVVPNGIDPQEWAKEPEPLNKELASVLERCRTAGRTVVGYAGSMGLPNALDTLLDAARLLRDEPYDFVLVGDGHERQRLQQRIADEGLVHVHLMSPIPKAQIPSLLSAIDIAYIGWQRQSLYRFGIAPNKLMDYMMAACVVLHSVEAGNDPVAEAGCGITVPPTDAQAVAQGLRQLAHLPPDQRHAMGQRGRAFVQSHHSYPILAQRFLQALKMGSDTFIPDPVYWRGKGV